MLTSFAADTVTLEQLERRHWGAREGAPLNIISMVEDKVGLIWFTSPSGLYTFNGITFAAFPMPQNLDASSTILYTLSMAPSGRIWGASRINGVLRIDAQHRVTAYGKAEGLPTHPVTSLMEDARGEVWAVVDHDLYHLVKERWQNETLARGLQSGDILGVYSDRAGQNWITTKTSLYLLPATRQKAQQMADRWTATTANLIEDPRGGLWVDLQSSDDLQGYVRQLAVPGHLGWYGGQIHVRHRLVDAIFDSRGNLWISGDGLDCISFPDAGPQVPGKPVRPAYTLEHLDAGSPQNLNPTHYLMVDNQGDVWVSTVRGLDRFRVPTLVKSVQMLHHASTLPDLAPGIAGQVWLAPTGGRLYSVAGTVAAPLGKPSYFVGSLFQERSGDLWFHSANDLFHLSGGRQEMVAIPPGLSTFDIRQIVQLPDGSLLFMFYNNPVWRLSQGNWSQSPIGKSLGEYPIVLFVDSHSILWAGYPSGAVTRGDGVREERLPDPHSGIGGISAFYEGPAGMLIAGQKGIAALLGGQLERLHFADDSYAIFVTGILQSENGDLWLNGRFGVARIAGPELQRGMQSGASYAMEGRIFTEHDLRGPTPIFYDLPTAAKDKTGRLWFNTAASLTYIDPSSLSASPVLPTLGLLSILADGQKVQPGMDVPAGTHTVRIQYFGSNLTAPERVRYRYRLPGVDDKWQYVDQRTEAVYTGLRPGSHTFEVCAENEENVWTTPTQSTFRVVPTFVQKPVFLALCALLLVTIVVALYRLRIALVVRALQQRADTRLEERVQVARDLHDTLLQGFQGVILRIHVAVTRLPERDDMREQLEGALLQAETVLLEGRDQIVQLRENDLAGINLVEALRTLGEQLAINANTNFRAENIGPLRELKPYVKNEIYWIAREALTNVFSHAQATEVTLLFCYGLRDFRFTCQDDGRGFQHGGEQTARPGHYGIIGMRERAAKIKAQVHYASASQKGTCVEVTMPARAAYVRRDYLQGILGFGRTAPPTQQHTL